MAKKKTRGKKKSHQRSGGPAPARAGAKAASTAPRDDEHDEHDEEGGHGDDPGHEDGATSDASDEEAGASEESAAADGEQSAAADDGAAPKSPAGRRGRKRPGKGREKPAARGPVVDPNIPSPDGDSVSSTGGLYFVAIIFGLIVVAIIAQFFIG